MESGELVIMGQNIDAKNIGRVSFLSKNTTQHLFNEIPSPRIAVLLPRTEKKVPSPSRTSSLPIQLPAKRTKRQ
ncbi:hypothetical protein Aduo_016197 [Ancylostoma duodenale]